MISGILTYLFATGAVALAEIGDKTQLLAMAFATKYKTSHVMLGVFIATVLNHAVAVALGVFIASFAAIGIWIQAIAAISFILFGLWTIKGDTLDEDDPGKTSRFGAITTVVIAFFIAELGDKTQLTTIALAAKFPAQPFWILAGTTTGMLIADALGICISATVCRRIPQQTIQWVSAMVFILLGLVSSYQVAVEQLKLDTWTTIGIVSLLIAGIIIIVNHLLKKSRPTKVDSLDNVA